METKELELKLSEILTAQKAAKEKAADEEKRNGTMHESTKNSLEAMQKQLDAIDVKLAEKHLEGGQHERTLEDELKENESVSRILRDKKGHAVVQLKGRMVRDLMEGKTTITDLATGSGLAAVGAATTGVLQIDRTAGITMEARQVLKVRDVLSARPTTMALVDFVKVSQPMTVGSPVVEASTKVENQLNFTSVSEKVRTIATWLPATRQVLSDFSELAGYINSSLPYYVNLGEELQLLSGDGTGENLHGLVTQATAFNTALLNNTAGWTRLDVIARAIEQIMNAKEIDPTFVILNTADWWSIRLTKDGFGRYILGDPQTVGTPQLWNLSVVPTTSISSGTFLVGSGLPIASEIRDRMEMEVEISTEHSDFFVKNLVAIRAEKRLCLVVKRPASYITGTFSASPSS